jgi:hypothetical protein
MFHIWLIVASLVFLIKQVYSANGCRRMIRYLNFFYSIVDRARHSRSGFYIIYSSSQFHRGIHRRITQSIMSYVEFYRIEISPTIWSNHIRTVSDRTAVVGGSRGWRD